MRQKKGLNKFFSVAQQTYEEKGENFTRTATVCHDLGNFHKYVCEKRCIKEDENDIILGADDGKGILKVTMTILPKQNSVPKDISEDQSDDIDLDNSINDSMEEEIPDLVDDDSDQSYLENEKQCYYLKI